MKALKATGSINDQGQIALDQPLTSSKNSRIELIILIPEDTEETSGPQNTSEVTSPPKKKREAGILKGKIWMSDDFDEPLEDLKDYM